MDVQQFAFGAVGVGNLADGVAAFIVAGRRGFGAVLQSDGGPLSGGEARRFGVEVRRLASGMAAAGLAGGRQDGLQAFVTDRVS